MFQPVKIRRYLALMRERGFDADAVLAGTNIEFDKLNDPMYLVDLDQCQAVVANMIRLSGDASLGLSFGNALRIADLGIVGHALLTSSTLRQAATLWLQYSQALVDMLVRFKFEEHANGRWTLSLIDVTSGSRSVFKFCADELLVIGLRMGGILCGEPMQVAQLKLSYQAPGQEAYYRELFGCEPQFGAARTEIEILTPHLDQQLRQNSDELSEVCLQHCSSVMRRIASGNPILLRMRSILLRSTGEPPTIAAAAAALGMSERTLRRRLSEAGVTYQGLLDEYRCDLATEYFRSGQMKPKQVAYLLGYKNAGSFRRAFKTWTGNTVGDFLSVQSQPPPITVLGDLATHMRASQRY